MTPGNFRFLTDFVKANYTTDLTVDNIANFINLTNNTQLGTTWKVTYIGNEAIRLSIKGVCTGGNWRAQLQIDNVNLKQQTLMFRWIKKQDYCNDVPMVVYKSTGDSGQLSAFGYDGIAISKQTNLNLFSKDIINIDVDVELEIRVFKPVRVNINTNTNYSHSTSLTREQMIPILNDLVRTTTTKTLTIGSTNLAKLTDEDKKIATDKGWTLA